MNRTELALRRAVASYMRSHCSPGVKVAGICTKALEVDEKERSIVGVITTEDVDHDEEIVKTSGISLTTFRKNPIVLFMHDHREIVGKSLWQKVKQVSGLGRIVAKTQFADTLFAQEIFALMGGGFLRGLSVGLNPRTMEIREPNRRDLRKLAGDRLPERIIVKCELLEYSIVTIPANAEALSTAVTKGLVRYTEPYLEPLIRVIVDAEPRPRPTITVIEPQKTFPHRVLESDELAGGASPARIRTLSTVAEKAEAVRALDLLLEYKAGRL